MLARLLCVALLCSSSAARADAPTPLAFKLHVPDDGVYRVTHADLVDAGLAERAHAASAIGLECQGRPVPLWVEDGGDGSFGPGDHLEFVGTHLAGEHSDRSEFAAANVYWLRFDARDPLRVRDLGALTDAPCPAPPPLEARLRIERDLLRMRFAELGQVREDVWYWARLTPVDDPPFEEPVVLAGLDTGVDRPVTLRAGLRGWSRLPKSARGKLPEHRTELQLDGEVVATVDWDTLPGTEQVLEAQLPASRILAAGSKLGLRVPERRVDDGQDPVVDVVLLNWIEIRYPRTTSIGAGADRLRIVDAPRSSCVALDVPRGPLAVYAGAAARAARSEASAGRVSVRFSEPVAGTELHVVAGPAFASPEAIVADRTSTLARTDRQADYLVLAHPSLLEAVLPLVEFHRARGLTVETIDVTDVYDEFNHGVVHPRAIRDFVRHASAAWRAPRPRFVLLVGDASWDVRSADPVDRNYADKVFEPAHGTRLPKNRSTPYEHPGHRNLIPTWAAGTHDGQAASDNWFVAVLGDDELPDLAIGRFPVVEPEEVAAIVRKTLAYAAAEPGPWNRRLLWVANEDLPYQRVGDDLAERYAARGFESRRIYPVPDATSNAPQRRALIEAFDEGQLLVHFIGHGGRYIWRTGPRDLEKNEDLFTLGDLEALQPNARLPVVLSMTCYSAPFDHPTADSIGEKLLRLSGRGAVAVIAASWRNAPTPEMSGALLDALSRPGTVGEALVAAKHASPGRDFVEQYNLLGDPALALALPPLNTLKWTTASEVDNFGFDVYRADEPDGPFRRITVRPILGAGTRDTPSDYRFEDADIDPRRDYWYYVESISMTGTRERFTPVIRAAAKRPAPPAIPTPR